MRTDSTYDTKTRSLFAIAEVANPYESGAAEGGYPLTPGMFVDVKIKGKIFQSVIVIPRDGLRPEDIVYVVNDEGIAEVRNVTVIDKNPKRAVLASGLEVGEYVILSPLEKSQISLKFKALDVNDPSIVLVEPKEETKGSEKGFFAVMGGLIRANKMGEGKTSNEKQDVDTPQGDSENADSVKKRRKGKGGKKPGGAE